MNLELLTILQMFVPAAAVYAAIRADLARLHERTTTMKLDLQRAHDRLDELARR